MGQVACLGARALHHLGIAGQHGVEVIHQRLHLGGEYALQPGGACLLHILQAPLQRLQGFQPYRHLGPGGRSQQHQQHQQRQAQHARELRSGRLRSLQIGRHDQAPARSIHAFGTHGALQHQQGRALRAHHFVHMHRPIGQRIRLQGQAGIPQGARAQHPRPAAPVGRHGIHLPVQARVRLEPARVRQRLGCHHRLALGIKLQPRRDLVQLLQQGGLELPLHMLAEEPAQHQPRQDHGHGHAHHRGSQQPEPQRPRPAPVRRKKPAPAHGGTSR